ncbi:hypothetical protein QJQ45_027234 [Haematococcus lacustris]|nr:hypothetical protein QJQ45_027234 [Haematococcus lacustris]
MVPAEVLKQASTKLHICQWLVRVESEQLFYIQDAANKTLLAGSRQPVTCVDFLVMERPFYKGWGVFRRPGPRGAAWRIAARLTPQDVAQKVEDASRSLEEESQAADSDAVDTKSLATENAVWFAKWIAAPAAVVYGRGQPSDRESSRKQWRLNKACGKPPYEHNMSRTVVLRLYRSLLQLSKGFGDTFAIREPLAGANWGTYASTGIGLGKCAASDHQTELLDRALPGLSVPVPALINASVFHRAVRDNFKANKELSDPDHISERVDEAFRAIRMAGEQLQLASCSSSSTTDGVTVEVTTVFTKTDTNPYGKTLNYFTYRVRVINNRLQPIKVLGRAWTVLDHKGQVHLQMPLDDNAVVGQKPCIPPGTAFQYHSGLDLESASGTQSGQLKVVVLGSGDKPTMQIIASIGPLELAAPQCKHAAAPLG